MNVKTAINKRFSTRDYQAEQNIEQAIIDDIIDAGRFAPNGLGCEPWKFFVIKGDLTKLATATNNQPHIQSAGFVVALVNYKQELIEANPEVFVDKWQANGFDEERINLYLTYTRQLGTQYYREQLMFAASQMCLQATEHGIGSVIVGGYDKEEMANILGIDQRYYEVGLLVDFGIPKTDQLKVRNRRAITDVVTTVEL